MLRTNKGENVPTGPPRGKLCKLGAKMHALMKQLANTLPGDSLETITGGFHKKVCLALNPLGIKSIIGLTRRLKFLSQHTITVMQALDNAPDTTKTFFDPHPHYQNQWSPQTWNKQRAQHVIAQVIAAQSRTGLKKTAQAASTA